MNTRSRAVQNKQPFRKLNDFLENEYIEEISDDYLSDDSHKMEKTCIPQMSSDDEYSKKVDRKRKLIDTDEEEEMARPSKKKAKKIQKSKKAKKAAERDDDSMKLDESSSEEIDPEMFKGVEKVEGIIEIVEERGISKDREYKCFSFNGDTKWYKEIVLKYSCPERLRAFKRGEDYESCDNKDQKKQNDQKQKNKKEPQQQQQSTKPKYKEISSDEEFGDQEPQNCQGLQQGNSQVLGKRKFKRIEDSEDDYEISDSDKHKSEKKPVKTAPKKAPPVVFDGEYTSPKIWKNRNKRIVKQQEKKIQQEEAFEGKEAKCIKYFQSFKEGTEEQTGYICKVEWMTKNGINFEPTQIPYEVCRKMIPGLLIDFFDRSVVLNEKPSKIEKNLQ